MARKGQGVGVRLVMTLFSVFTLLAPSPPGSLLPTCLSLSCLSHGPCMHPFNCSQCSFPGPFSSSVPNLTLL